MTESQTTRIPTLTVESLQHDFEYLGVLSHRHALRALEHCPDAFEAAQRLRDVLQSHKAHGAARRQSGPKWAKEFGGIKGRCKTNPEDVPDVMMTAKEFWRDYANCNSAG